MCCGVVPILFGWFLSVPSLHALVFLWKTFLDLLVLQHSKAGFHTKGGEGWNSPQNLEIEYDYYCGAINISYLIYKHKCVSSKCCLESLSKIVSEAI